MHLQQSSAHDSTSVAVYTEIGNLSNELHGITNTLKKQTTTLGDFDCNLEIDESSPQLIKAVMERILSRLEQQREDFVELERDAATARDRVSVPMLPGNIRSFALSTLTNLFESIGSAINFPQSRVKQQGHPRIHHRNHHFPPALVRNELSGYEYS